jgi:hypothetical protein
MNYIAALHKTQVFSVILTKYCHTIGDTHMFAFIQRLFGAAKHTAQAVAEPEVARAVVSQPEPEQKKPAAKRRAKKASKQ